MQKFFMLFLLSFSMCFGNSFHVEKSDIFKISNVEFIEDKTFILLYDKWEQEYQAFEIWQENWAYPVLYPTLLARYGKKLDYASAVSIFGDITKVKYGFSYIQ